MPPSKITIEGTQTGNSSTRHKKSCALHWVRYISLQAAIIVRETSTYSMKADKWITQEAHLCKLKDWHCKWKETKIYQLKHPSKKMQMQTFAIK